MFERALEGEDIPPYEKEYIREDGSTVFTEVRTSLERDDHGDPIGIVAVVTDITERRSLELEIAQYTQTLETANEELQQPYPMNCALHSPRSKARQRSC